MKELLFSKYGKCFGLLLGIWIIANSIILWVRYEPNPDTLEVAVGKEKLKMVLVKGGTFRLGETEAALVGETQFATKWLKEQMPQHRVTLSDYYIGVCEVTQGLWKEVMKNNPSKMKGDNLPVTDVSWYDALQFGEALNLRTKLNFRLPTDAEWVYAARSGERQEHYRYAGSDVLYDVAWAKGNAEKCVHAGLPGGIG